MKLRSKSSGFTLIEILVALSILALLALLAASAFDGSRSKAQAMISLGKQVGDANIMLKTDTGCYVNKPVALFNATEAQKSANNYCGRTFKDTWARPYMAQYTVDSSGNLVADKIGAGVTVSFPTPESASSGGRAGKLYFVRFGEVPKDVIKQALVECNNTADEAGDFSKNRCRTTSSLTDDAPGDFDMLYDTTR